MLESICQKVNKYTSVRDEVVKFLKELKALFVNKSLYIYSNLITSPFLRKALRDIYYHLSQYVINMTHLFVRNCLLVPGNCTMKLRDPEPALFIRPCPKLLPTAAVRINISKLREDFDDKQIELSER